MPSFPLAAALIAGALGQSEPQQRHWAIALGQRLERVNRAFPCVDRVVLVPDGATYVDELSKWSPRGRWPVLIEDDHFAPLFIRRFEPARVMRREPVEDGPAVTRDRLEGVIVSAWGGDPQHQAPREVFAAQGFQPAGVVVASTRDPAWTAAVALAAGHGQPIGWLDEPFGRPNRAIDSATFEKLRRAVDALVAGTGYARAGLGDAVDAITLCREVGGRVDIAPEGAAAEIRAVTDLLGRDRAGGRYAFTGWIFGGELRSAYVAMCSLFLDRRRFRLLNTYREPQVNAVFGMEPAARVLRARKFDVEVADGREATKAAWLAALPGGLSADALVFNSSGNPMNFHLADGRAYSGDVPTLNVPLALHFTHSHSMRMPGNEATVGGQWLAHGAYAYIGSVDEPRLPGFVPPASFADRCAALVPFLVAGRKWDDSPPWKIQTFGDPLMVCPPPLSPRPPRIEPGEPDGLDLREHVKGVLRRAEDDPEALREAAGLLRLLGEDEIVTGLWRVAARKGTPWAAARGAFGALFRADRRDELLEAWRHLPARDPFAVDMLWHAMTPRLGAAGEAALVQLETVIRPEQREEDLRRLLPQLVSTFGAAHAQSVIQREAARTSNPKARQRILNLGIGN